MNFPSIITITTPTKLTVSSQRRLMLPILLPTTMLPKKNFFKGLFQKKASSQGPFTVLSL